MAARKIQMNSSAIKSRLRYIRLQLALLEAEVSKASPEDKLLKFKDLEGLWEGKTRFSYEEIKTAQYKVKDFPE